MRGRGRVKGRGSKGQRHGESKGEREGVRKEGKLASIPTTWICQVRNQITQKLPPFQLSLPKFEEHDHG